MTHPAPGLGHPEQENFIGAQWSDKVKCPPRRFCRSLFAHWWRCDVTGHNKHQSHNITTGQILCIFTTEFITFNKKHKTGHIYTSHMINGTIKLNLNCLTSKWRSKLCDLMMIVNVRNGVGRLTMSNNDLRLSWSDSRPG